MQLNFKTYGEGVPLVILHGLLGSLDNWNTLAKKFAENHFQVFIIDQRNHGHSPHTDEFSYEIMADDLLEFCRQQQLEKINLIGHSMGGKTAMLFAHRHPEMIDKLIIADIAPVKYKPGHNAIFEALLNANIATAGTRDEVEQQLAKTIKEYSVRQFLMKGLTRGENNEFEWRFNIPSLVKNYPLILDTFKLKLPYFSSVLFIRGSKSDYIDKESIQTIEEYFPNYELATIEGAGHWLHAEKPKEFLQICLRFLEG